MTRAEYTLTVSCPDKSGLIAEITNCIASCGGNILNLGQHTATDIGIFFCKADFSASLDFDEENFRNKISEKAGSFSMEWTLYHNEKKLNMAVLVSKTNHCLYEILLKHKSGLLYCNIPVIVSNHPDLRYIAEEFSIPYYVIEPSKGKLEYEKDLELILKEYKIDLVCLARYMQIMSPDFTNRWKNKIINIHHGFLPAFKGAKPYHQAWTKGVKIIGATAHFANEDLDQGPIIFQDVVRVRDNQSIQEFVQMGADVERHVIVEGLKRYFDHSIFLHGDRTFVIE